MTQSAMSLCRRDGPGAAMQVLRRQYSPPVDHQKDSLQPLANISHPKEPRVSYHHIACASIGSANAPLICNREDKPKLVQPNSPAA